MPLATLIALVLLSTLTAFAPQTPGQSVLGDLPRDRIDAVMRDLNRALDIECVHCHVDNEWKDESKPAFATARNMLRMVRTLNEGPLKDVGEVSATCAIRDRRSRPYTLKVPSRSPR
jgi:Photosynthetic reaction centre cytochrome C subunit